ncbi:ribokinase [Hyphobacterium marinum]|uniref:Ribokinase n=1 Tax=Hyphobacterium marinum TaxID=3116574 RepID=A0ABU7LZH5_9PROT|nr:ribokinase [Hyphobacterium sp. Y6023]MEE2566400.1 ribokinase [Hyphobacterium sp. Y6023]
MSAVRITVAGSVNLDLVARCPCLPRAGETVLGGSFAQHPGGKGANQALAARRLGADVALIACVGADAHADAALALLKADGVDLTRCRALPDVPTGVALIAVSEDGENQIVVAPGANARLRPEDIPDRIESALLAQLEVPVETVLRAAQVTTGMVALNLAPALPVPDELLSRAGLVMVNETEAETYGTERLFAPGRLTAITLGAAGAELYRGSNRIARSVPPRVEVVDTTGAGDTSTAALLVALEEGREPQAALDFACAAGALAVTREGAQTALPRRAEVDALG